MATCEHVTARGARVELHLHACVCRNLEKPSEAGFYAIIVNRVIDESLASSITMTTGLKNEGKY